ncbi:MAG: hypothetical protein DME26_05055, partial [Verrucomicrobia bacterium]
MLATLLALLGLAAGIVIGRQPLRHAAVSHAAPQATAPKSNATPNPKPPATKEPAPKPTEWAPSTTVDPLKILSLEEASAGIEAALAENNQPARYEALQKIASAVVMGDIPKALALADAITYRDLRTNFVSILISRWAESDPVAAITYAQRLTKGQEREQAIVSTLNVWAKHDTAAAIAWSQQLSPGELRNQAT